MRIFWIFLCMSVWGLPPVFAAETPPQAGNDNPEVAALRKEVADLRRDVADLRRTHDTDMADLRRQLAALAAGRTAAAQSESAADELTAAVRQAQGAPADSATAAGPGGAAPGFGGRQAGGAAQSANPDLSVVGNFVAGHSGGDSGLLGDKHIAGEMELGLSGNVDSFLRYDGVFSIHPDENGGNGYGISVEEAYVSPNTPQPGGLDWKLGRFRADFGKANEMHLHALPWPDYPLALQKCFGDEGLSGDGASVSWLAPGDHYLELTAQSFVKTGDALLGGDESQRAVHLLHAKTFFDLSGESTLELGASAAAMPQSDSGNGVTVEGLDLTYKWRPQEKGLYHSFRWMTEVLSSQRGTADGRTNSFGFYTAPEYQFARQWAVGTRLDYAQDPDNSALHTQGAGVFLTFMQSEYCYWRLGYEATTRNDGSGVSHGLMLQLNISLGPHPAHKY
jgi:hypothetical protein